MSGSLDLIRHTPVVLLTVAGEIVDVSEAAMRLFKRRTGLVGASWSEFCSDPADRTKAYLASCARTTEPLPGVFHIATETTPKRFRCDGYTSLRPDGNRLIVILPRTGDEFILLGQKIDELNTEIQRRKAYEGELQRTRAEAESANVAKDEFLAMLGHELRNPLAPILTALQLMRLRGAPTAERERTVIERQVKHMVRLVDDLLDISRITQGKITLARDVVDLAEVTARAIEIASPIFEQQRHQLSADVPRDLFVVGDAARLAQVFSNLLTNAAKYTPPGGHITVGGLRHGDEISLFVRDTGVGLAPDFIPRVFDLFVQGRQAIDRAQGGLGLGLAIVRRLVELHGGRVTADSEGLGRGATFTVHLPAAAISKTEPPPQQVAHAASTIVNGGEVRRVLVVDDNQDAAELLSESLQLLGYITRVAHDGPSALHAAKLFHPDIALLDIGLPVMDGYELARQLRQQDSESGRRLRLIAVTGYGQETDRQRAREAGFDEHLVKPVDLTRLAALLAPPIA